MKSIVVLLTLFSFCQIKKGSTQPPSVTGCPERWIRFLGSDRCYYISPSADTYENAVKDCASRDSELAPPITCDEHFDLNAFLVTRRGNSDEVWIGINNLSGNGWKSTKGIEIGTAGKCTFWARHFPRSNGTCVLMSYRGIKKDVGEWINDDCNKKLRYVCIMCGQNFQYFPDLNYQYFPEINECLSFNAKPKNWMKAQSMCAIKWGGHLLRIRGPKKQKIVEEFLKPLLAKKENEICVQRSPSPGTMLWLSAQTANPNDCKTPFVWKATIELNRPFIYSNWSPGKPNCANKGDNCAVIAPERDYKWEDTKCGSLFCYVCEYS